MKIRNGFVSNSSSSSFIIGVPKDIAEDKEKLHQYMFGNNEIYPNPNVWDSNDTYGWPAHEVVDIVFNDIHKEGSIDCDRMLEAYTNGYTDIYEQAEGEVRQSMGLGPYGWPSDKKYEKMWQKIQKLMKQKAKVVIDNFISDKLKLDLIEGSTVEVYYNEIDNLDSDVSAIIKNSSDIADVISEMNLENKLNIIKEYNNNL